MNKENMSLNGRDGALRRPRPSEVEDATNVVNHAFGARFRRPCASLGDGDIAARCPYHFKNNVKIRSYE